MKKILIKSALISLGINLVGLIINLITFFAFGSVFLAIPLYGGEWCGYMGFGVMMNKTFPMTTSSEAVEGNKWLSVSPLSFIIPFIIFFVITLVIQLIKQKVHNR